MITAQDIKITHSKIPNDEWTVLIRASVLLGEEAKLDIEHGGPREDVERDLKARILRKIYGELRQQFMQELHASRHLLYEKPRIHISDIEAMFERLALLMPPVNP